MKQSNYELTKRRMQGHFLDFDQNTMIRRFGLQHDAEYLYIRFVGRLYRIDRKTGRVQWSWDDFCHGIDGSFHEAMSIYDLLCCSKEGCQRRREKRQLIRRIEGNFLFVYHIQQRRDQLGQTNVAENLIFALSDLLCKQFAGFLTGRLVPNLGTS